MKKGLTLIELLLYVSIASILLISLSGFLAISLGNRAKSRAITEVEQQGEQVIDIITQSVRNSTAINQPAQGISAASLSINTPIVIENPTVFDLSAERIRIIKAANPAVELTNSKVIASNLTFTNLSFAGTPGIVRVTFTLSYKNLSNRNEYNFSKSFRASASRR